MNTLELMRFIAENISYLKVLPDGSKQLVVLNVLKDISIIDLAKLEAVQLENYKKIMLKLFLSKPTFVLELTLYDLNEQFPKPEIKSNIYAKVLMDYSYKAIRELKTNLTTDIDNGFANTNNSKLIIKGYNESQLLNFYKYYSKIIELNLRFLEAEQATQSNNYARLQAMYHYYLTQIAGLNVNNDNILEYRNFMQKSTASQSIFDYVKFPISILHNTYNNTIYYSNQGLSATNEFLSVTISEKIPKILSDGSKSLTETEEISTKYYPNYGVALAVVVYAVAIIANN